MAVEHNNLRFNDNSNFKPCRYLQHELKYKLSFKDNRLKISLNAKEGKISKFMTLSIL